MKSGNGPNLVVRPVQLCWTSLNGIFNNKTAQSPEQETMCVDGTYI